MTTREAFAEIDTPQFNALVNIASGPDVARRAIRDSEVFKHLSQWAVTGALIARAKRLLTTQHNPDEEHPADVAIATILLVLQDRLTTHDYAVLDGDLLQQINNTPNLWWARKLFEPPSTENESAPTPQDHQ